MTKSVIRKNNIALKGAYKHPILRRMAQYKYFYLLLFPTLVFYAVFSYLPMYGITIAFREFSYIKVFGGEWVGPKYFMAIFTDHQFWRAFYNTIFISVGRIIFEFPLPIIMALLLTEINNRRFKRFCQTVFTFPHFISWVVASGLIINILSSGGILNQLLVYFGMEKVSVLTSSSAFRALIFISDSWKEMGWSTIIYLATIASINPTLYEAAIVDGAKRFHMMRYITLPSLRSVIGILLILAIANMMNAGFDQIFNLYNATVYDVSDIVDTFIYRKIFVTGASLSATAAFGLFKSVINVVLLYSANFAVKKINNEGIY